MKGTRNDFSNLAKYMSWLLRIHDDDLVQNCGNSHCSRHDDVIKWKHIPRYWPFVRGPFVRGIHRSPVNSPHKGQWRGALMFSLICPWINGWVNNREADLRRHRAHYDVIVMTLELSQFCAKPSTWPSQGDILSITNDADVPVATGCSNVIRW